MAKAKTQRKSTGRKRRGVGAVGKVGSTRRKRRLSGVKGVGAIAGRRRSKRRGFSGIGSLGNSVTQIATNVAIGATAAVASTYVITAATKSSESMNKHKGLIQLGLGLGIAIFGKGNQMLQAAATGVMGAGAIRVVGDYLLKEKKGDLGLLGNEDIAEMAGLGFMPVSNDRINLLMPGSVPVSGVGAGDDDLGDDDMAGFDGDDDMAGFDGDDLDGDELDGDELDGDDLDGDELDGDDLDGIGLIQDLDGDPDDPFKGPGVTNMFR